MSKFHLLLLCLLVAVPLAGLSGLAWRLGHEEQLANEQRRQKVASLELERHSLLINAAVSGWAGDLKPMLDGVLERANAASGDDITRVAREFVQDTPEIDQVLLLDPAGAIVHPPLNEERITLEERSFLQRSEPIWHNPAFVNSPTHEATNRSENAAVSVSPLPQRGGWVAMARGRGIDIYYCRSGGAGGGWLAAVELDPSWVNSRIIAALPATNPAAPDPTEGCARLLRADGSPIYSWGRCGEWNAGEVATATSRMSLAAPLSAWGLSFTPEKGAAGAGRGALSRWLSIAALGIALAAGAVLFHREQTRRLREAAQRVSFVNQVSHELKTPLTNIRMYAELAERELVGTGGESERYLRVITGESQRLGRMIGNILAFARQERGTLLLHKSPEASVDEVIARTVEHFVPAFAAKRIVLNFAGGAPERAMIDGDALAQILGNLLGNVEKYAGEGARAEVASRREGDRVIITVRDDGPGIDPKLAERVFEPFFRASDKLTDGVAGAGIGLTIARSLAERHGGGVRLIESSGRGAAFEVWIEAPLVREEAKG